MNMGEASEVRSGKILYTSQKESSRESRLDWTVLGLEGEVRLDARLSGHTFGKEARGLAFDERGV